MRLLLVLLVALFPVAVQAQSDERQSDFNNIPAMTNPGAGPSDTSPGDPLAAEIELLPEIAKSVEISNTGFTRVHCQEPIQDIIPSREKTIIHKYSGNNGWIKFLYLVRDGKSIYATKPMEINIVCGGEVYRMIANPKPLPVSPTIRLSSGKKGVIKENASLFSWMPLVRKCIKLVHLAYKDAIPDSFDVVRPNSAVGLFKDLKITLRRVVVVEGEGLKLKEYEAVNSSLNPLKLSEKVFLNDKLTSKTLWVSLSRLNVGPGDRTRLFIVEQTGGAN